jgi:hypothetical protein
MDRLSNPTQDVINAYIDGLMTERERVIKLIDSLEISFTPNENATYAVGDALDLIAIIEKGEL